jgi:hypothetical protein
MRSVIARRGVVALGSLTLLGLMGTFVMAQPVPAAAPNSGGLPYRVGPGLTQQQASTNAPVAGQAGTQAPAPGGYAGPYAAPTISSSAPLAYPPPYVPAAYGPTAPPLYNIGGDPYGGYLQGAASVIGAQGGFMIARQQSNLVRQQVIRAKMDNRRRAIEDYLYERANLPTVEDDRERLNSIFLKRSKSDPPLTEVWNGSSLNALLNNILQNQNRGARGPNVPIDEDVLRNINVSSGKDGANAGVFKPLSEGKPLAWPQGITDLQPADDSNEVRGQIDSLAKTAVKQAIDGRVDPAVVRELNKNVTRLQDMVLRNVADLPPTEYIDAKRYLNDLSDALKILRSPDAGQYFTTKYVPQGKNVADLVAFMSTKGLQFAPSVSGGESSYLALQRAMAAYDAAASSQLAGGPEAQR